MTRKLRKNINGILVFLLILSNLFASPFIHVKAATDEIIFTEGFESGSKGGYAKGNVTLSSGNWTLDNALIGSSTADRKIGNNSVRAYGPISMNFNATDVKDLKFKYANYGSDSGATWTAYKSTDSGATWTSIGNSTTISSTLAEAIIPVNQKGNIRFKIEVTGTSSKRLNIDDVTLTKLSAPIDDTTPPTVTANPVGGTYSSEQSVTLTASEAATIYYTLDGIDPSTTSTKYTQPINISTTTTLKFMAIDTAGNQSTISTESYILEITDITPPTVSANPKGGTYTSKQSISLSASELATIYYTLDGTDPTTASSIYSEPITISSSKTLKFIAVDTAENQSTVNTETYTIDLDTPAVIADKDALAIGYGDGDLSNLVTKNIILPVTGQNGSTITWSSNNLAVVTNDGLVTRPSYGTGDKTVTLSATIQKGTASATKTFTITVKQNLPQNAIFVEGFESSLKSGYTSGTVNLPSGVWTLDNTLIGKDSGDKKNESWSVRSKVPGSFYMNFDVSNVKEVIFSHVNYGSDKGGSWKLLKSTDAGLNWVEVSSSTTIPDTLSTISIPINQLGNVRFKVESQGISGARLNFDDFVVIQMEHAPLAPFVNPVTDADEVITGTSEVGTTIVAKVGSQIIGSGITNDEGRFDVKISRKAAGTVVSLTAIDDSQHESLPTEITVQHDSNRVAKNWTEDSSLSLQKSGKWIKASSQNYTDNTVIYSTQKGASVELFFNGSGIRWYAITSLYYGLVDVYLDGEFVKEVNLLSNRTQYSQLVFEELNLEKGIHTIKLVNKGIVGGPQGISSYINIDAFDIIEDKDVMFPNIPVSLDGAVSSKRVNLSWDSNQELDLKGYNIYRSLDNVNFSKLNSSLIQNPNFIDESTEFGKSYFYKVTAVDTAGNESDLSLAIEIHVKYPTSAWTEDSSPEITTSGKWIKASSQNYTDNTVIYSTQKGASVELFFNGSGIRWYAITSLYYGLVDVYLDGEFVKEVNLLSNRTQYSQLVFEELNLEKGIHTIKLVNKGIVGGPQGIASYINIDAFDIIEDKDVMFPNIPVSLDGFISSKRVNLSWGSNLELDLKGYNIYRSSDNVNFSKLTSSIIKNPNFIDESTEFGKSYFYKVTAVDTAGNESDLSLAIELHVKYPTSAWTEDSSPEITTSGNWIKASSQNYTDNTVIYSTQKGASVELFFNGSGIRWYAITSLYYGLVDVYLDGVFIKEVNLMSNKTQYSQLVFEELNLEKGIHSIKLVNKGIVGGPQGISSFINIDAIDVLNN
jgi:fibronectin type 3 domain-containing protein